MAEKLIQTRIVNKHDTYENWKSSSLVLKAGEIALASIPTEVRDNDGTITIRPTYLMKVGDGEKTFSQLNWLSATASDVYSWAKVATADEVAVNGKTLANHFSELVQADGELVARLAAVEGAVGTGGSVDAQIQAAIEALDVEDAAVEGQFITAVAEADGKISITRAALKASDIPTLGIEKIDGLQAALNAKAASTYVDEKVAEVAAQASVNAGAISAEKSRAESKEAELAGNITKAISDLEAYADQAELDAKAYVDQREVVIKKYADDADAVIDARVSAEETARKNADTELSNRLVEVENALADVENVMDFVGAVEELPTNVAGYQKGDVIVVTAGDNAGKEYVFDGSKFVEFGYADGNTAAISGLQARMNSAESDIDNLQSQVGVNTASISSHDGKIAALETSLNAGGDTYKAIEAAQAAADQAQQEVDNLETVVANNKSAIEKTVSDNKAEIEQSVSELSAVVSGKAAASTVTELSNKVDEIEGTLSTEQTNIDNLQAEFADGGRVKVLEGKVEVLQGNDTVEGSVAKALKDAKAYTDNLANNAVQTNTANISSLDARIDKYDGFFGLGENSTGEFPVLVFDCGGASD